ncbi:MAG: hypothetical protein C0490_18350 [Marivirga sp.]|nr:hypothetical protein [Marivirga sp.]
MCNIQLSNSAPLIKLAPATANRDKQVVGLNVIFTMRNLTIIITLGLAAFGLVLFGNYWINTQPIWLIDRRINETSITEIPGKNKQIIYFLDASGMSIAPSYNEVVCTQFVIKVINKFTPLTKNEMNEIRILTTGDIGDLIKKESSIIKGVQTALVKAGKGTEVKEIENVKPGDLVQFWNLYQGKEYGHCGVVFEINANKSLTLYSSHPLTDGFGIQKYMWPDRAYFVRLN